MSRIQTNNHWSEKLTPAGRAQLAGYLRRRFSNAIAAVATPGGRGKLVSMLSHLTWPAIARPAATYRATIARRARIYAVVGSLGKSTTKHAVAAALGIPFRRVSEQNCYEFIAFAIFRILPWTRRSVIETGVGRPGEMKVYCKMLRPDVAVVTSISSEHIREFGSLETTRAEKSEIVRALPSDGLAVLNGDDPNVMWMSKTTRARIVTFGFGNTNQVRASDATFDWPHGMRFRLTAPGLTCMTRTRLVGRKMIYPFLAAVAVALEEGMAPEEFLPRLESLPPVEERLQPVALPGGGFVLRDDYKATLESVDMALDILGEIQARRKIVVLGDVECPDSARPTRRRIGGRIGEIATQAIFIGSDCQSFAAGAFRGGLPREAITKAGNDLDHALAALPTDLGPDDVVLVKGRPRQRLGRIALAALGRTVKCRIRECPLPLVRCTRCKMLERGWDDAETVAPRAK
jgi:UDP-N-acetylmuramyl pentapeptide synthase